MQRENKVLFGAVLILLVAIISFSFAGITGQTVSSGEVTKLSIDKSIITAGDLIKLTIKPGSDGTGQDIDFYSAKDDTRAAESAAQICGQYKCFNDVTVEFMVPGSWEGDYYARVADKYYENLGKEKYIKAYFSVKPLELPKGPQEHN